MNRILMIVLAVLVVILPGMTFACPPPPVPGYSGPDVGPGPTPSPETDGYVETGGDDLDPNPPHTDGETGSHTI